jgi:hypothetical protein
MKGVAYLELWCLVGQGRFFSRALQDTLTGTTEWRPTSTPFFLQPTDPRPDRVLLGVRLEGPGSVWLDDVTLTRDSLDKRSVVVRGDLVGGAFGLLAGAFGILAGALVPRGRARLLVLGLGAAIFVGSVCLAATAAALFIAGHPSGTWMALGLPGAIGTVLFAVLLPVIHRRYRDAELRRLAAMDLAGSEST